MMCERALSRQARDGPLASLEIVQEQIADSWIELEQFRLLVLRTAWLIDRYQDYRRVKDIAAVKATMPKVLSNIASRPAPARRARSVERDALRGDADRCRASLADGPTEVHKVTVARQVLREYKPVDGLWPSAHLPTRRAEAGALRRLLEHEVAGS